jgi:hypothetical protein
LSEFTESVDEMIASHFGFDALRELRDTKACEIKDRKIAERIIDQLIRAVIAHARTQVVGRRTGTMRFDEAMNRARRGAPVTRPNWGIFRAVIRIDPDDFGELLNWTFDNTEGTNSGTGSRYTPTDEDRAATDWMIYQNPEENWVELKF